MKDELLTIQQAANLLGVSSKTLRRWEAKGFLTPHRTIGNQRRYSKSELTSLFSKEKGKIKNKEFSTIEKETSVKNITEENVVTDKEEAYSPIVNKPIVPVYIPQPSVAPVPSPLYLKVTQFSGAIVGMVLFLLVTILILGSQQIGDGFTNTMALLTPHAQQPQAVQTQNVLAASNAQQNFQFQVSLPSFFGQKVNFLDNVIIKKALTVSGLSQLNGGIKTNNADINAGKGKLTASNVIYSIHSGSNITISGDKQNPTISANVVGGVT